MGTCTTLQGISQAMSAIFPNPFHLDFLGVRLVAKPKAPRPSGLRKALRQMSDTLIARQRIYRGWMHVVEAKPNHDDISCGAYQACFCVSYVAKSSVYFCRIPLLSYSIACRT